MSESSSNAGKILNANPPDVEVLSPAKINLFLHVTGQRSDGYHLLQTWMQFLDWGDRMTFRINQQGTIQRHDDHAHVLPSTDLCILAAERLKTTARQPKLGVDITLAKQIPPGTGLGGGSSNAATTLMVLNRLWGLHLPDHHLMELGRKLGADVPVFLQGVSAWAEHVGDHLTPALASTGWLLLALPDVSVSSHEIFQDPELQRDHPPVTPWDYTQGRTGNDLEAVTFRRFPVVAEVHRLLSRFGPARMSGSGSAVFLPLPNPGKSKPMVRQLPDGVQGIVTRRINRNPVLHWVSKSGKVA